MPGRLRPLRARVSRASLSLVALWGISGATACTPAPPAPPATPAPGPTRPQPDETQPAAVHATLALDDPQSCRACHATVVAEWEQSQHARAHHAHDPIYAAMRSARITRQGAHIVTQCAQCHTPRDVQDHESAIALTGVNCATCHASLAVEGHNGAASLTWRSDGVLAAARDVLPGASPAHGTGPAVPHLADGTTMCLACHAQNHNPAGLPTCTTGVEAAQLGTGGTCVSCHMPEVATPSGAVSVHTTHRSHTFAGPQYAARSGDRALTATALGLAVETVDTQLRITLHNRSGHSLPTGFPGRLVTVSVTGRNAAGEVVWTPVLALDETARAAFSLGRFYGDDSGAPEQAPFATQLLRDSRLAPGETRTLTLPAPPAMATEVLVAVDHHLVPPPARQRMGLHEDPAFAPQRLATWTAGPADRVP